MGIFYLNLFCDINASTAKVIDIMRTSQHFTISSLSVLIQQQRIYLCLYNCEICIKIVMKCKFAILRAIVFGLLPLAFGTDISVSFCLDLNTCLLASLSLTNTARSALVTAPCTVHCGKVSRATPSMTEWFLLTWGVLGIAAAITNGA